MTTPASNLSVTEIKAFVPSKDFELSKRFYQHMGFTMASEGGGVAYFHLDHTSFLLQDFCIDDPSGVLWRIAQNTA